MKRLVAGIGNVFCGDDGFGVAVVHRLKSRPLPGGVRVMDIGTRARDLTYTLLDGWDLVILVDATSRGKLPGTVTLLELETRQGGHTIPDAHALVPEHALAAAVRQGAELGRVLLVGCEPQTLETRAGPDAWTLSPAVVAALEPAVDLVERLVLEGTPCTN